MILRVRKFLTWCTLQDTLPAETHVHPHERSSRHNHKKRDISNLKNKSQNNLIRMIIVLNKKCHISQILKVLKIYNKLYIISKLKLLNSIRNNNLTQELFNILFKDNIVRIKKSKSFLTDLSILALIIESPNSFIRVIKNQLTHHHDGISDSI